MGLQLFIMLVLSGFSLSLTHALPAGNSKGPGHNPTFDSIEKLSSDELVANSASMKKSLEFHLGIKFWKYIYGEGRDKLVGHEKTGRELTAENCAACAIEENQERVQELKQREDGFKFVQTLITTIFSPLSLLLKGNAGGATGAATGTAAGKAKHGKEPVIPETQFGNLAKLMTTLQLPNGPERTRPFLPAVVLLRSPYIQEMGELGRTACKETPNLKSQKSNSILENFCTDQAQSIKLLDSLDTFVTKME